MFGYQQNHDGIYNFQPKLALSCNWALEEEEKKAQEVDIAPEEEQNNTNPFFRWIAICSLKKNLETNSRIKHKPSKHLTSM